MKKHANEYSQAYRSDLRNNTNYSFWSKDFNGMAFKTMLRQLISKWGIMSVDFQTAITNDMAVIEDGDKINYIDNKEDDIKPEIIEAEAEIVKESAPEDPLNNFNE